MRISGSCGKHVDRSEKTHKNTSVFQVFTPVQPGNNTHTQMTEWQCELVMNRWYNVLRLCSDRCQHCALLAQVFAVTRRWTWNHARVHLSMLEATWTQSASDQSVKGTTGSYSRCGLADMKHDGKLQKKTVFYDYFLHHVLLSTQLSITTSVKSTFTSSMFCLMRTSTVVVSSSDCSGSWRQTVTWSLFWLHRNLKRWWILTITCNHELNMNYLSPQDLALKAWQQL